MKKILLLSTNQAKSPYPVPPLGLALIHNTLKADYDLRFVDGFELQAAEFCAILDEFQPDYVGLSIRNIDDMVKGDAHSFLPKILENFVIPIKEYKKAPIILGGSGFTIFPYELMDYLDADYGFIGEAEEGMVELCYALDRGDTVPDIAGLVQRGKVHNKSRKPKLNFGDNYRAELDLVLDYGPYRQRGAYPVQTKRGCVHRCIYCSYPVLEGRSFRTREVSQIVDEIENTAKRMDDSGLVFEFVDSTFNDPPGHAEAICREIIGRGLKVSLRTMGMNPVNITRELLELMLKAGFSQIDSTPDTASPVMLKNFRKNFTYDQLVQAAKLIRECDMPTMWFFIFGGPGETKETIAESFAFIDKYVCSEDMVNITEGLRIYPQTALADLAAQEKVILPDQSLLFPMFYVSSAIGEEQLSQSITQMISTRPNCIRLTDTRPPPELLQAALAERKNKNLTEPMFRTLLRLKQHIL